MLQMMIWFKVVEQTQYLSSDDMLSVEKIPFISGFIVLNTSPVERSKMMSLFDADITYLASAVNAIPVSNIGLIYILTQDWDIMFVCLSEHSVGSVIYTVLGLCS